MITRRHMLFGSALFPLAVMPPQRPNAGWMSKLLQTPRAPKAAAAPAGPLKVVIMSKFLQFLDIPDMAAAAKEMGFDGIDLCVRAGAHVLPDRCEDDLPKAVETIRRVNLEVPMLTAAIVDANSPHAEKIMRTASRLGIRYYRWGGFRYVEGSSIPDQLESFKPRIRDLAALNRQYGLTAMYHTHSGPNEVGACVWDLWYLLKDFNPDEVGVNYDVGHATVEGGFGGCGSTTRGSFCPTRVVSRLRTSNGGLTRKGSGCLNGVRWVRAWWTIVNTSPWSKPRDSMGQSSFTMNTRWAEWKTAERSPLFPRTRSSHRCARS